MKNHRPALRALVLALGLATAGAACADSFVPELAEGINFIGLAAGSVPDYMGSKDNTGGVAPYGRYYFSGDRYVQLLGPELTVNLLDSKSWRVGPIVRYRFGRDDDVSDKVVKRMRPIDDTVEAGLFVAYRHQLSANPLHQVTFNANLVADTGDTYNGTYTSVAANYFHPFAEHWMANIGIGASYGSSDFNQTYFGVTGSDIALYPSLGGKPYKPSSGVVGVTIPFGVTTLLSKQWAVSGGGRYQRLQSEAEDSPIVSDRGDANQWMFGIGAAYLF
jgi:MipA family protein